MITVVGSLNMDLVVEVASLPVPGETVLGSSFRRAPGGKGANQAVAAARLGSAVVMIGAVGDDVFGAELIANLARESIETKHVAQKAAATSGVALIAVDRAGENQIVVSSGANDLVNAAD